jgi:hypothetical protein
MLDSSAKSPALSGATPLQGSNLLRHVRALLRLPNRDGQIPDLPLWEEARQDLLRLPRRGRDAPSPSQSARAVGATPPVAEPADLALSLFR